MIVLTAEQMSSLDRQTIEQGKPGINLMRAAGDAVFDVVSGIIEHGKTVAVICGKGNNGGDGFRTAERLARADVPVSVYLLGSVPFVQGDAKTCLEEYLKTKCPFYEITSVTELHTHTEYIHDAGIIVDALFGTGLTGNVTGLPGDTIEMINRSDAMVVAVDIPSGVDSSDGSCGLHVVTADHTVTFGCLKVGHVVKPGAFQCGSVHIADIGFFSEAKESIEPYAQTLILQEAADMMPQRPFDTHKFAVGSTFVLAGSVGMTGAAALTSISALKVGAGMVILGCPESLNDIFEIKLTEVMTKPLPEVRKKRCLSIRALGMLRQMTASAEVTAIGPGLGVYGETSELVRRFIAGYTGKVVLDADGINAFSGKLELLAESPAELVLTPHYGELARLMGCHTEDIVANPRQAAIDAAQKTGAVVLLKGSPTIIASPTGTVWLNGTGNEGMATAGSGDVLTGMIAGLAAQGLSLLNAAVLGAYLHGRAGDIAADDNTVPGMISGDMVERIPMALSEILTIHS